jgi:hypothetical protein
MCALYFKSSVVCCVKCSVSHSVVFCVKCSAGLGTVLRLFRNPPHTLHNFLFWLCLICSRLSDPGTQPRNWCVRWSVNPKPILCVFVCAVGLGLWFSLSRRLIREAPIVLVQTVLDRSCGCCLTQEPSCTVAGGLAVALWSLVETAWSLQPRHLHQVTVDKVSTYGLQLKAMKDDRGFIPCKSIVTLRLHCSMRNVTIKQHLTWSCPCTTKHSCVENTYIGQCQTNNRRGWVTTDEGRL